MAYQQCQCCAVLTLPSLLFWTDLSLARPSARNASLRHLNQRCIKPSTPTRKEKTLWSCHMFLRLWMRDITMVLILYSCLWMKESLTVETVKRNQQQYGLPLKTVSHKELYGRTMDAIVQKIGFKNNCTFCGVFWQQALDKGAMSLGVDKIVTGYNANDIAETVLMNVLRGDIARLRRCTAISTGAEGTIPRSKPFKYTY